MGTRRLHHDQTERRQCFCFEVQCESGLEKSCVLRRNMFLSCQHLVDELRNEDSLPARKTSGKRNPIRSKRLSKSSGRGDQEYLDGESDKEEEKELSIAPSAFKNEPDVSAENGKNEVEYRRNEPDHTREIEETEQSNEETNKMYVLQNDGEGQTENEVPLEPGNRPKRFRSPPERLAYHRRGLNNFNHSYRFWLKHAGLK